MALTLFMTYAQDDGDAQKKQLPCPVIGYPLTT